MERNQTTALHQALFEGKITGLLAVIQENERPLLGLAARLDWRFSGQLSRFAQQGKITGKDGECVYLPIEKSGKTYHLLLVGAGPAFKPGTRQKPSQALLQVIKKNLKGLSLKGLGVSREDLGGMTDSQIHKELSEDLWITD